jgi:hypothetical protein
MTSTFCKCIFAAVVSAAAVCGAEPNGYLAGTNGTSISIVNPATGAEEGFIPVAGTVYDWAFTPNFGGLTFATTYNRSSKVASPVGANLYVCGTSTGSQGACSGIEQNGAVLLQVSDALLFAINYDLSVWIYSFSGSPVILIAKVPTAAPGNLYPGSAHIYNGTLWFTSHACESCGTTGTLTGIDLSSFKVAHTYQLNFLPLGLTFLNSNTAYIAGYAGKSHVIEEVNLNTGAVENTINFPAAAVAVVGGSLVAAGGNQVATISTTTQAILNQATLPFTAGGAAVSKDGKTLYVSGPAGPTPGQTTVQPVTVQNLQLGTPFSLPYPATGIRMNPVNGTLTSASNTPNLVASYNVGSDGVEPPSPIYGEATAPSNAAIPLPDGSKVYSVSATGTSIRVLNGSSLAPLSEIPVTNQSIYSTYPGGAASPDGSRAYLLDIGVQVVDATTDTIVGNIPPTSTWTPTAVAVSPDSSTLFVTWQWQGHCQVTSYKTGNLQQIANSGSLPGVFLSASVSPDGTKLYLLDAYGGILAVLDASTLQQISLSFDVPGGGGVLSADESTLYTLVGSGGPPPTSLTLEVVDVATLQVLKTYPIALPQGTNFISSAYLALTPDGSKLTLSVDTSPTPTPLTVIDPSTGSQIGLNTYLIGPSWFAQ